MLHIESILLLGEGDFSFCRALSQHVEKFLCRHDSNDNERQDVYQIIATSFDMRDDVIRKYPSSEKLLLELERNPNIHLRHGVDATKRIDCDISDVGNCCRFQSVVFNFPHLGSEDCKVSIYISFLHTEQ